MMGLPSKVVLIINHMGVWKVPAAVPGPPGGYCQNTEWGECEEMDEVESKFFLMQTFDRLRQFLFLSIF